MRCLSLAFSFALILANAANARSIFFAHGAPVPLAITGVAFGTPWPYNSSYPPQTVAGDGWANTWSNDDKIYIVHDDTSTWNGTGAGNNVLVSTVSTTDSTAVGTLVNMMTPWCCGNTGSPARSHKAAGIISVAGKLYAQFWRLDPNWATTGGASIGDGMLVMSSDHGANWVPQPPSAGAPYASGAIMWPGANIPFGWVQYGKDYAGAGPHNSANYVYAMITMGGSGSGPVPSQNLAQIRLARVPIGLIGNQAIADWQYWQGGDGMASANWGSSLTTAADVLNVADAQGGKAGLPTSMQYLPRYGRYLYIGTQTFTPAYPFTDLTWIAYVCDAPWNCNPIPLATHHWSPQGYYMPGIMPKSLVNGGQQVVATAAGDSSQSGSPTGYYTLTYIPITITP